VLLLKLLARRSLRGVYRVYPKRHFSLENLTFAVYIFVGGYTLTFEPRAKVLWRALRLRDADGDGI
jgi:hypothetical protein